MKTPMRTTIVFPEADMVETGVQGWKRLEIALTQPYQAGTLSAPARRDTTQTMVVAAGHNRSKTMRAPAFVSATVVAALLAIAFGSPTLFAESDKPNATPAASVESSAAIKSFAALKGVKAVPMTSKELSAVKGLHVHFVTPSKNTQHGVEGLQLAGDIKTENNWSNEWGGIDGEPVAPSYKGLCVATGLSGSGQSVIFIPGGQFQCPL